MQLVIVSSILTSEVNGESQKPEVRSQKSEVRSQKSESDVRHPLFGFVSAVRLATPIAALILGEALPPCVTGVAGSTALIKSNNV